MKTLFNNSVKSAGGWPGFILLILSVYITYMCAKMLAWEPNGNLVAYGYQIWGDWSAHFTFISQFRERGLGWVFGDNPLFQGVPFQYPFLSHLFTQAFAAFGSSLGFWNAQDVAAPTYVLSLLFIFLLPFVLYFGIRSLGLQARTTIISILLFLFAGGVQFLDSSVDPSAPLTNQPNGPNFTNLLIFEFFPQRAFLFGLILFVGLGALIFRKPTKERVSLGVIFLPFLLWMHVHSWIAMALLLICLFAFHPKAKTRKSIFLFGLAVAVISVVLLKLHLLRASIPQEYLGQWQIFSPGWFPDQKNLLFFWVYQTGIFLPMAVYGFYLHHKNYILRPFFMAGAILFLIAFFIRFQPNAYDNLKLFTYTWLFLSPFVALAIESFLQKKLKVPLAMILFVLLTASGFKDTLYFAKGTNQNATLFNKIEFDLAEEWRSIRESPEDVVLINPRHNHWVTCLGGSPAWMGYPGWLWSWGINYFSREQKLMTIIAGKEGAKELLIREGMHYAVFKRNEEYNKVPVNIEFFQKNYKMILSKSDWVAFDLRSPPTSVR